MVNANDVLNSEMLKLCGRGKPTREMETFRFEQKQKALTRREAWEDAARRRFPGRPDWEAFDLQREWDEEHQ